MRLAARLKLDKFCAPRIAARTRHADFHNVASRLRLTPSESAPSPQNESASFLRRSSFLLNATSACHERRIQDVTLPSES